MGFVRASRARFCLLGATLLSLCTSRRLFSKENRIAAGCEHFCKAESCNDEAVQDLCGDCPVCLGKVRCNLDLCTAESCDDPSLEDLCADCPSCQQDQGEEEKQEDPCSGKIVHGIGNSGNDCFLCATMQLVLNSPPVCRTIMDQSKVDGRRNPIPALQKFTKQYVQSEAGPSKEQQRQFREALHDMGVVESTSLQEDASEAFIKLLSLYSLADADGSFLSTVRMFRRFRLDDVNFDISDASGFSAECSENGICETEGVETRRPLLTLPITKVKGAVPLSTLYEMYVATEHVNDPDNAIKVRLQDGRSGQLAKFDIVTDDKSAPPEFLVHVKRFDFDLHTLQTVKINTKIDAPLVWKHPKSGLLYSLIGIVLHHGPSAGAGHYTAYRKLADGTWVEADDSHLIPRKAAEAQKAASGALMLQYRETTAVPDAARSHGSSSASLGVVASTVLPISALVAFFL